MMAGPMRHHGIDFARHYAAGPGRQHFNASTAISRLHRLAEDALHVGAAIKADEANRGKQTDPWGIASEYEVFSYYSVGVVTCLEWHGRSRLADLFTFLPTALTVDDLRPLANPALMSQMIASEVSAAQLIAGMTNVATPEKYLSIFKRVYDALGLTQVPHQIVEEVLARATGSDGPRGGMENLRALFEFRNDLVHEIGASLMGAYAQRVALSSEEAAEWCAMALKCIHALEAPITEQADKRFPNRIDHEGRSQGEQSELDDQIGELEAAITARVDSIGAWSDEWRKALRQSRAAFRRNEEFHRVALFVRLYPNTADSARALRKGRISYLKEVLHGLDFFI